MFRHIITRVRTLWHWVPILIKHVRVMWRGYKQWCFDGVWARPGESRGEAYQSSKIRCCNISPLTKRGAASGSGLTILRFTDVTSAAFVVRN